MGKGIGGGLNMGHVGFSFFSGSDSYAPPPFVFVDTGGITFKDTGGFTFKDL